jgi:hypothetical protein
MFGDESKPKIIKVFKTQSRDDCLESYKRKSGRD